MNNKRVEYMDTLKGLLIILVVFGHTGIDSSIQKWIYSFHMPLFLIISGFFYKESRDIISLKRIKRLVLPFIGFTILAIIFPGLPSLILKNKPIEWSKIFYLEERIFFNTPIWFLIVLFFIEIKINLINKITNYQLPILLVVQILPLGIRLALCLGLTFYIGVIWREKRDWFSFSKKNSDYIIAILLPFTCFLGYSAGRIDLYKMEFSDNLFYYYLLTILNLVLWIEISKKLENISILKVLGQNTLLILGTHYYVLFFLRLGYKVLKLNEVTKEFFGTYFLEGIFTILVSYIMILVKEQMLTRRKYDVIKIISIK